MLSANNDVLFFHCVYLGVEYAIFYDNSIIVQLKDLWSSSITAAFEGIEEVINCAIAKGLQSSRLVLCGAERAGCF